MPQGRRSRTLVALAIALILLFVPRAARGDVPPTQEREASVRPWSGWWWPLQSGPAPHLDDPDGPLAKYDRYCVASGRPDPHTRDWEQAHSRSAPPDAHWWGHCHGWAAAAVLEPEPTVPVERSGVRFSVSDLKGLLTAWHAGDGPQFLVGGARDGVAALDFHQRIQHWLVDGGRPLIIDTYQGGTQVWNFPAYRARLEYRPADAPGSLHVTATLWFVGTAGAESTGTQSFTRTYTYVLTGDPRQPAAAQWEGDGDRPWVIWYPDPALRLREQTPPGLDPNVLRELFE